MDFEFFLERRRNCMQSSIRRVGMALGLIVSASSVLSLSAAAIGEFPQGGYNVYWKEPNLQTAKYIKGPVKEMKEENAYFEMSISLSGIEWKEGAKRVASIERFNSNGICVEWESYDILTGALEEKTIVAVDSIPRSKEENVYDAQQQVIQRVEYSFDSDGYLSEEIVSDPAGKILERWVFTRGARQNEIEVFNGSGTLILKQLIFLDRSQVEVYDYDESGNLESKAVSTDTGLTTETIFYDKNEKFTGRSVSVFVEPGKILTSESYDENNSLINSMKYVYEGEDAYGNWLKRTLFNVMSTGAGEDLPIDLSEMPSMAEYRTFTYHEQTRVEHFSLY